MKKILLASLALLLCTGLSAQKVMWGIKAGACFADRTNSSEYYASWVTVIGENAYLESTFKPSFFAGIFAQFELNDKFSIQPEIVYSRQGDCTKKVDNAGNWENAKIYNRLDYINVPIMVKWKFWKEMTLDFGPQFGYMLDYSTRVSGGPANTYNEYYWDNPDAQKFDVSMCLGLSYRVHRAVDFSVRYNWGFLPTTKNPRTVYGEEYNQYNRVIQVGVGLWL